ncbi:MAG: ComEC family competence protein [Alistipes sp.]|nr:ComEC family competence protein [Alistipes sp.]
MAPFVKLLVPAGAGILFATATGIGWGYAAACLAVTWAAGWMLLRDNGHWSGSLYPWLSVFFFFAGAASLAAPDTSGLPTGEYIYAEVVVGEEPVRTGNWQQSRARVTSYRIADSAEWLPVGFGINIYLAPRHEITSGERLLVKGYFNAYSPADGSYGALMKRRGLAGRMYVTESSLLASGSASIGLVSILHNRAVRKVSSLPEPGGHIPVVTAMVSGDKRSIDRATRESYRQGGGAHLLAVSGLHVGIVFILVNLLLYLLPLVRGGHILKNIVAAFVVWLFAAAAGLSPSVVRAALMFSFLQFALAGGVGRNALNILAGSAFVMLALNPNNAADPSFILSYAAVLAIVLFFGPLYGLLRTGSKLGDTLISVYLVAIVASLAVAPFVSYWFGSVPLAGILVNPVVIFTAHVIVFTGVIWLVWPFAFAGELFGWIASAAVSVQNAMMRWCASLGWGNIEAELPLWAAVALYCILISASYPLRRYVETRRSRLNLPV